MTATKPWLRFYEPHVSEHIDYPSQTLPSLLKQTAAQYSYRAVDRFAAGLQKLGVTKGDRVALHLSHLLSNRYNCLTFNKHPERRQASFNKFRMPAVVEGCAPCGTRQARQNSL